MLHGADISAYQSTTVPDGDFVIIKATEGLTYVSSKLSAQLADARKKGKLVGFYHFGHPKNDPVAECEHFHSVVASKINDGDVVVLDHEVSDGMSAAHCATWAKQWLQHAELRLIRRPVVYTYLSFAKEGRCAGLGGYPLWIAHYTTAGHPSVPAPWSTWTLHQYTDTPTDKNVFAGSVADWRALGRSQPTPMEDDMIERELKPGLDSKTEFLLPPGRVSMFVANADNTYQNTGGVKATAPVQIRVAIRKADGTWQSKTGTVGRAATDKSQPEFKLPLSDVKSTFVSVTRVDGDGTEPIVVGAY
jgi:lysozyme